LETIIIGGGQAGLATSYYLVRHGREHIVLEQAAQAGNVWRNERWDSFTFVSPNWSILLPGAEYAGPCPDDFMPRDEIVEYFRRYEDRFHLPVRHNTRVTSVEQISEGLGYQVCTPTDEFRARNVVVATGFFQTPKLPSFSSQLPSDIKQLTSGQYRNPAALPPGAVLVVGSGQSGCQIAEDLYQSGRTVYLCVGSAGRVVRRYRGKDIFEWLLRSGFFDRTSDMLPSSRMRFAGMPQVSGARGGHSINLHQFARDGVVLLGHILAVQDEKVLLAGDLMENLARADKFEADLLKMIDDFIEQAGIAAPAESVPILRDGFDSQVRRELNLREAGITSIIWATGFKCDFSWVKPASVDGDGYPKQHRGVTSCPGLYFVGLPWLSKLKSGLLIGVGEDAAYVASHIAGETRD
jgi:putative flavoprotein involved in K+ transport